MEEVLKAVAHMRFEEAPRKPFLNPLSSLPASKRRIKESLRRRIRFLCAAYISLASFVSDEDAELFWEEGAEKKKRVILRRVVREMEKNRREIEEFNPFS